MARVTLVVIAIIAIFIARDPNSSVFQIVSLLLGRLLAAPLDRWSCAPCSGSAATAGALWPVCWAAATIFIWKFLVKPMGGVFGIYELLPGFLVGLILTVVVSLATPRSRCRNRGRIRRSDDGLRQHSLSSNRINKTASEYAPGPGRYLPERAYSVLPLRQCSPPWRPRWGDNVAAVFMQPSAVRLSGVARITVVSVLSAGVQVLQIWRQTAGHLCAPPSQRYIFPILFITALPFPSFPIVFQLFRPPIPSKIPIDSLLKSLQNIIFLLIFFRVVTMCLY